MTFVLKNINAKPRKLNNITEEKWLEVPGSNGDYLISNYGRLKSFQYNKKDGEILSGYLLKGYRRVQVTINGKKTRILLHKLVAEVWIPKPTKDSTKVIHKNWNKKNNHVSNLEWLTPKEVNKRVSEYVTQINKTRTRTTKVIANHKLTESEVKELKLLIKQGFSQATVSKIFQISATQVKRITSGENWGHVQIGSTN